MPHSTAAILSLGDELTLGQRLNTNSHWLAARLLDLSIETIEHTTVPDDLPATTDALRRLASRADLVISTGGLGPTADDLCRPALAAATGDHLVEEPAALEALRARFRSLNRDMPDINRVQAQRPSRAALLPNSRGTAPGLHARLENTDIFCLPGPPHEMEAMFDSQVRPHLQPPTGRTVRTRALHCFGIGESDLATRLGPLMARDHHPIVGTTASGGIVSIRVRSVSNTPSAPSRDAMDQVLNTARAASSPFCFGENDTTLELALLHHLRARHLTLAVVESCTGGMLGEMLTRVPGSSETFRGGWITYSNDLKTSQVGVPPDILIAHGAVSRQTAEHMSRGGLSRSNADHCLAITGIAGPKGGTPDKPVGAVWISLAQRCPAAPVPPHTPAITTDTRLFNFSGADRHSVRQWSARAAMMILFLHLTAHPATKLLREVERYSD